MDDAGPVPPPGHAGVEGGPTVAGGAGAEPWPAASPRTCAARARETRKRSGDSSTITSIESSRSSGESWEIARPPRTSQIIFKVRRRIAHLDIEHDPSSWLYTVAVNACRDHYRSAWWRMWRQSVPIDSAPESPDLTESPADDPERAYTSAEDGRRVGETLGAVVPVRDLRASVILHDFEGLPHEEIARITNTTHSAARKRHSRALAALATLLGKGETP